MNKTIQKMEHVLEAARPITNARGTLASLTALLSPLDQKRLACDFAERTLLLSPAPKPWLEDYASLVRATRQFINGDLDFSSVEKERDRLYSKLLPPPDGTPLERLYYDESVQTAHLAFCACCQREVEGTGKVIRSKYQPQLASVATAASYAMARFISGLDWDAADSVLRAEARRRGHEASRQETLWQIEHLVAYVTATYREGCGGVDSRSGAVV